MRSLARVLLTVGAFSALASAALAMHAQRPALPPPASRAPVPGPAGPGAIGGTAVVADTGLPVRKARVTLAWGDPQIRRSAMTDAMGHFEFTDLPAADFTLTASRTGYLDIVYGQGRLGAGGPGTPIHLESRQKVNVILRLPREGALNGVVTDENGDPAFNIQVIAMRVVTTGGARTAQQAGKATTDDRGIYRISGLTPGAYIVSAIPPSPPEADASVGDTNAAASTIAALRDDLTRLRALAGSGPGPSGGQALVYYPGTASGVRAIEVVLDVSEERLGIDIPLQFVPTFPVWGQLVDPGGHLPPGVSVMLIDPGVGVTTATANADGMFMFTGIAPGIYKLMARFSVTVTNPRSAPINTFMLWGTTTVSVDERLAGALREYEAVKAAGRADDSSEMIAFRARLGLPTATIDLRPGLAVWGRLAFQATQPATSRRPVDPRSFSVVLTSGDGAPGEVFMRQSATVDASGVFIVDGVMPGHYGVAAAPGPSAPSGWTLTSAIVNGRDALDFGLEVTPEDNIREIVLTFADRPTEVSGTLTDAAGKPTSEGRVVIFAADTQYWLPESRRLQAVRPGTDGHFAVRGLPPGDYRVAMLGDVETGSWYDPMILRQLQGGSIAITLADGERKVQDLRLMK